MARVAFTLVSAIVASEDAALANLEEFDDGLSLLQLSSRRSGELEDLDHTIRPPWTTPYGLQPKPAFGPDGTWATPYCKDIQGCSKPYCPPGCNGGAYWEGMPYDNTRLNVKAKKGYHFLGCLVGSAAGSAAVVNPAGGILRCLNSESATKPAYWPPVPDEIKTAMRPKVGAEWGLEAYGKEYCPDDCVNDCAAFKFGNFLWCGDTDPRKSGIYDGSPSNNGPNRKCQVDEVTWMGAMITTTWCGERTTTTTAPPVDEKEALEEIKESDDLSDEGDEAAAEADPHIRTNKGKRFDLQ